MAKLIFNGNELSIKYPELAKEWDYEKNYPVTPDDVSYGSAVKYWWICPRCGNVYQATPNKRTCRKTACPLCARKDRGITQKKTYASRDNLAEKYPNLVEEWDYNKNQNLPKDYSCNSNEIVWWKCKSCGHEWKTSINHRTGNKATSCPSCSSHTKAKKQSLESAQSNNLVKNYPDLINEWNYDKNIEPPENFSSSSNFKVWWKCDFCGNEWKDSINHRTRRGSSCPNCSLVGSSYSEQAIYYYIKQLFPEAVSRDKSIGIELDIYIPSKQIAIEYDGIFYHNSKTSLEKENIKDRICKENNITLYRIRDPKLPNTENSIRIDCQDIQGKHLENAIMELLKKFELQNDIKVNLTQDSIKILSQFRQSLKEKSIAIIKPELIDEWDYEKNGKIKPEYVSYGTDKKYWWKCSKCGYEWMASVNHRVHGRGCPKCVGHVVTKGVNDLLSQYPNIANQWDYEKNMDITPEKVSVHSSKKIWWKCDKGHRWQASVHTRVNGSNCPYCANYKALKGFNDLATIYPKIAAEWHPTKNGNLTPYEVTPGTDKKVWWKCSRCEHEWQAVVYSRKNGCSCPKCAKSSKKHE